MQEALRLLSDRLPGVQERAESLYETDEVFRDLCNEYLVCCETTARMEGGSLPNDALRDEYRVLRLRLEGEVLRYLVEHPGS